MAKPANVGTSSNLGAAPSSTVGSEVQPCDRQAGVGLSAFTHRFPPHERPARTAPHPPIRRGAARPRGLAAKPCTPLLGEPACKVPLDADALRRVIRMGPSRMAGGGYSDAHKGPGVVTEVRMTFVSGAAGGMPRKSTWCRLQPSPCQLGPGGGVLGQSRSTADVGAVMKALGSDARASSTSTWPSWQKASSGRSSG